MFDFLLTCFLKFQEGNKKYIFSAILGFLLSFSFAPLYLFPLLFICFSLFFLIFENAKTLKSAFFLGGSFGYGHCLSSLYWFSIPALVGFEKPSILLFILTLISVPLAFSFFLSIVTSLTFLSPAKNRLVKIILFSAIWTAVEILRSYIASPINLIGYALSFSDVLIQPASFFGIFFLSFFTVLFSLFPASLVSFNIKTASFHKDSYKYTVSVFIIFFIFLFGGMLRLKNSELPFNDKYKIRIVNSNIDFSQRGGTKKSYKILSKYYHLTHKEGYDSITNVIWPESSNPYSVYKINNHILGIIKKSAPDKGSVIIGGPRYEFLSSGEISKLTNTMYVIPKKGDFIFYDKIKLVPFGEYIPSVISKILPIDKVIPGAIDYTKGNLSQNIKHESFVPFTPLICYEAFFPYGVLPENSASEVFINIANDAWYGNSFALEQFVAMTKIRSVEYGIPTLRASNKGISAVIDSYGRVIKKSDLYKDQVLDIKLPGYIKKKTPYSKFHNSIIYFLLIMIIALLYNKNYCNILT